MASPTQTKRTSKARFARLFREFGRIRVRLLVVNLVLVLVPVAGLEFARLYERQLLLSLERDMGNQATLLRAVLEHDLERGVEVSDPIHERMMVDAARQTRTRIRVLDTSLSVALDSHRLGPPEGEEPPPPPLAGGSEWGWLGDPLGSAPRATGPIVPLVERRELRQALRGLRGTATRLRASPPAVLLFLAEPIRFAKVTRGVVYVTRSTQPVLVELHRIRRGLLVVLGVAVVTTTLLTLLLAYTLTRPIERLARAARQIALGHRNVQVPVGGGGELTELGRDLAHMTRQLQARQRYISEFAADVAHEFKSPLTSIRGAAELLTEGAAEDPETRARFIRNILLDAERLERLVGRLLELSRIESSQEPLVDVDLVEVARCAVARSESPDQPISLAVDPGVGCVLGRSTDLETALLNLLDNALRYAPPGRPVMVEIKSRSNGRVALSVADEGVGVKKEHLAKLFDRFFTTRSERGGTGLGLAIVSSVAKAHAATVEVESEEGRGTRFTLSFPRRA